MNDAGVAPPGLNPIQKPMKELRTKGAPVARQNFPGVEHHVQVHAGLRAVKAEPFLDAQQDLPDAEAGRSPR